MSATDFSPLSSATVLSSPGQLSPERPSGAARELGLGHQSARPPRGFSPPGPGFHNVRFGGTIPSTSARKRGAKGLGLAYELRVHDVMRAIYGHSYRAHPTMLYEDMSGLRRAIPDGLLQTSEGHILIEVKYTHCELAWWQLHKLYLPLLTSILRGPIVCVEICRSYDPSVGFPLPHRVIESLHKAPRGETGVLVWRI